MGICGSKLCQPADQQGAKTFTRTFVHEGIRYTQRVTQKPAVTHHKSGAKLLPAPDVIVKSGVDDSSNRALGPSRGAYYLPMRSASNASSLSELTDSDSERSDLAGRVN